MNELERKTIKSMIRVINSTKGSFISDRFLAGKIKQPLLVVRKLRKFIKA